MCMIARTIIILLVFVSCIGAPRTIASAPRRPVLDSETVAASALSMIVKITTPNGNGTGFYCYEGDLVCTANHVYDNADLSDIRIESMDARTCRPEAVWFDSKHDLAIFRVPGGCGGVPFTYTKRHVVGLSIAVAGNPFYSDWGVTFGYVTDFDDHGRFLVDATVQPGNSGGPIFDMRGNLVGVIIAGYSRTGMFSGAGVGVPVDLLSKLYQTTLS